MAVSANTDVDVLIVGAGPTGLVLALWLTHWGVRVRIIDKTAEAGTTSRALAVQARTLEFYGQIGLADAVIERGRAALAVNLWVTGEMRAHVRLRRHGRRDQPLFLSDHFSAGSTRALTDRAPVECRRPGRTRDGDCWPSGPADHVHGSAQEARRNRGNQHGSLRRRLRRRPLDRARACSGSASRAGPMNTFSTWPTWRRRARSTNGELHVGLDKSDFLALFPLEEDGRVRLVGTVSDEALRQRETLTWDDINTRVMAWMPIEDRARELVFDVPRSPPRREALSQGPGVSPRRRRPHPQPRRRTGHEHRHRRRREPRLETRRGHQAPGATNRCSTATSPSASHSPGGWSRRPTRLSPR